MYLVKAWSLMGDAQMTIASLYKGMKTAISVMETAIVDSAEEGFANITLFAHVIYKHWCGTCCHVEKSNQIDIRVYIKVQSLPRIKYK
jgi:hypothetical protein